MTIYSNDLNAHAGRIASNGYIGIAIHKKRYLAHRLAFLWMTGEWPVAIIDHINGNKGDNRWENLREATHITNGQNRTKLNKNNTTGYPGVFIQHNGKFYSQIVVDGKTMNLPYRDTAEESHNDYLIAKDKYHSF